MENTITPQDYQQQIGQKERQPLPLLPELEKITAEIAEVKLQYAVFAGKPVYILDQQTQKPILDKDGNPIQKKEFQITFNLKDYHLSNGEPRKQWLKVGASWNDKSKLKKLCKTLGFDWELITPKLIVDSLLEVIVSFQLVNKESNGKIYQNINFDSIRLVSKPESVEWRD